MITVRNAFVLALLFSSGCASTSTPSAPTPSATTPLPSAATPSPSSQSQSEWWKRDVFYEIFVRSFADTNGDGIGDLKGVTQHLDDLKALGIDDVWLMPIFPSPSYHGYDVVDETGVNAQYGTLDDFATLIEEAHKRHMHVILDFVLNHTSDQHPWFIASSSSPSDPKRDWYVWKSQPDDRWRRPWDNAQVWREKNGAFYLGLFTSKMPDLNLSNDDVDRALIEAMRTWLARGVDGFRLDAVRHLIETEHDGVVDMTDTAATHALLKRVHAELAKTKPDVLLVAEAWSNNTIIATYTHDDETQLAFAFPTATGIVDAVHDDDRAPFVEAVDGAIAAFHDQSQLADTAPFLTNHDQVRAMRDFVGDVDKAKLAAAALFALPGTPFVYYGEEIGMQGGEAKADENKRTPMHWNASPSLGFTTASSMWFASDEKAGVDVADERNDPNSLWSTYAKLIALRHSEPALTSPKLERIATHGGGRGVVALLRASDRSRVLFVANFAAAASEPVSIELESKPPNALRLLVAKGVHADFRSSAGGVEVPAIDAHGFAFVELSK